MQLACEGRGGDRERKTMSRHARYRESRDTGGHRCTSAGHRHAWNSRMGLRVGAHARERASLLNGAKRAHACVRASARAAVVRPALCPPTRIHEGGRHSGGGCGSGSGRVGLARIENLLSTSSVMLCTQAGPGAGERCTRTPPSCLHACTAACAHARMRARAHTRHGAFSRGRSRCFTAATRR